MSRLDRVLDKVEAAMDYGNRVTEPAVKKIEPYFDSFNTEMQPIINRPVDWILFVYFTTHIPITIFFDLQAIYSINLVPTFLQQLNGTYIKLLADPFMNTITPTNYWFSTFIYCEAFFQLPFFFFAAYGVFKDKNWVRLPLAIYGAHVMTTVLPILVEFIFNQEKYGLLDFQRNTLIFLYSPYFLIPCLGVIDSSIRITKRLRLIDEQLSAKKVE